MLRTSLWGPLRARLAYSTTTEIPSPALIQLKVGVIQDCQRHPNADKLYVSKVITRLAKDDSDKGEVLTVCSGLVDYVPRESLVSKAVVLVTNLKPSKIRGVKSEAMLLAADKEIDDGSINVEVVNAPEGTSVGEELFFGGNKLHGATATRLKSKVWEELQKQLGTDAEGKVFFRNEDGKSHLLTSKNGSVAFVERLVNSSVR